MTATPRVVDLSHDSLLYGPERIWPEPETFEQIAAQDAVRSARKQGLSDRIETPAAVRQLATFFRKR